MPGQNIWTFHNSPPPNDATGNNLNGCHIVQTATGYDFTEPNINNVLASSTSDPPFFSNVAWGPDGLVWYIGLDNALTAGNNDPGTWGCEMGASVEGDPTAEGTFTAQAGQQMDADAASSAKA